MIISSEIQFDPFWTDLVKSDQKINKVENLMISSEIKFDQV
jgi:hypothetical protein